MGEMKSEASARLAPDQLGGDLNPYTRKPGKSPPSAPTFQRVTGDIGPVHLLGSPSPSVIIERRADKVLVWIESPPWSYGSRLREFVDAASPSIEQYAHLQCLKLRKLALAEQDRRERLAALRQSERGLRQ